jgi:uncharacterized protein (TIGR00369 family)
MTQRGGEPATGAPGAGGAGREGLVEFLGIEEAPLGPGRVRCALPTDDRHQNAQGVIHGSVTVALLDTAMGHAIAGLLGPGEFCSTTQLSVQFLRAARPGEHLEAVGEVTRKGRRVAYLEGTCRNGAGEVVARAHGTWYMGLLPEGQRPS